MSIIYDALQKVETFKPKKKVRASNTKRSRPLLVIAMCVLAPLYVMMLRERVPQSKASVSAQKGDFLFELEMPQAGKYHLQGVISDETTAVAMINGKKVNVGERVGKEASLAKVLDNGVELKTEEGTLYIGLEE